MNFQEQLKERITIAQLAVKVKHNEAMAELLDNECFIETQRSLSAKGTEVAKLDSIIAQLNAITPFKANSGDKFSVRVFPINGFETGLDRILGTIVGSRSAFVDDLSSQFQAITSVNMIEWALADKALGAPSYFDKKTSTVTEAIPGNIETLNAFLVSIAIKLDIQELPTTINQAQIDLWFMKSEVRAKTAKVEIDKVALIDNSGEFTIED